MAHVRFKTTIEMEVEVVGQYTGETLARGMGGPPELSEPGEPEEFELEAVLLQILKGSTVNVLESISETERVELREMGVERAREQIEEQYLDQQIAREEARRDREEDR